MSITDQSPETESTTEPKDKTPLWKQRPVQAVAGVAVIGLLAAAVITGLPNDQKNWKRPDLPTAPYQVTKGETVDAISYRHGQPAYVLTMVNSSRLNIQYPEICDDSRQSSWPRRGVFCNDRLNWKEAHTLVPHQQLRILASTGMPSSIGTTVKAAGKFQRLAILVDVGSQQNLDHAAAIADALDKQGKTAIVWVYKPGVLFQFVDRGRSFGLDPNLPAAQSSMTILSATNVQGIILVSGAKSDFKPTAGTKPVIGYCMAGPCEPGMKKLVAKVKGTYVPFAT